MEKSEINRRNINRIQDSIEHVKKPGMKYEVVIATKKCCKECDELKKLVIPFEEIVKKSILPYHKCSRKPSCKCSYQFNLFRDENGNIIKVNY